MREFGDMQEELAKQQAAEAAKKEALNAKFTAFLNGENPENQAASSTINEDQQDENKKPSGIIRHAAADKQVENKGNWETAKSREFNFGKPLNADKYTDALTAAEKLVSKLHENIAISKDENSIFFYTEVVEKAIKESQNGPENKLGGEFLADAFMLKTLSSRLKKKYEDFKEPGSGALEVSIYSTVGSDLEKDKGVMAIIECSSSHRMAKEKFYLTTKGYKRDIRKDDPEQGAVVKNFQNLNVTSISMPIPFGGFEDTDVSLQGITLKNNLPNKICNGVATEILTILKKNQILA